MKKQFYKYQKYIIPLIALATLFGGSYVFYFSFQTEEQSNLLKVVYLDIGQGDSIYIETPDKKQVLIDTGPSSGTVAKLSRVMPFADRSLDLLILTHPDQDHIGGASLLLDTYEVSNVLVTGDYTNSSLGKELTKKIDQAKTNKIIAERGQRFILDQERKIYLDILFPNQDISGFDSNETSIISKLRYGEKSFLFVGDSSVYNEILIIDTEKDSTIESDVLMLGHHGSKTSSSVLWLEKVNPDQAVISAGRNNRYGHPSPEVLDRLEDMGIPYLGTFQEGNVVLMTDGINIYK